MAAPGAAVGQQEEHVPFHQAIHIQPPKCSVEGIKPRFMHDTLKSKVVLGDNGMAIREDGGRISNTVFHAVVSDTRVSDAIGRDLPCRALTLVLRPEEPEEGSPITKEVCETRSSCRLELKQNVVLAVEAGCNVGKSHAVLHDLIRPKLLENAKMPMVHFSVRITHAEDLYKTCLEYYVTDDGRPIKGMELKNYREKSGDNIRKSNQVVISPQSAQLGVLGDDLSRFKDGVLVLDEVMSLALALGGEKDETIRDHEYLSRVFRELAYQSKYIVVMDRDVTLTPLVGCMLAAIAPDRDIVHVQFERAAQSNAFCYAINSGDENVAGRGKKLALERLECQIHRCMVTFHQHPDDTPGKEWDYDTHPTGPPGRRRLWIACAAPRFAQEELIPLCKKHGAVFRFYCGTTGDKQIEGTSAKSDVKDTTASWRRVHVIISTTTIEVAINIKLPFLARWLFATHHRGSLASELMQLVERMPRGNDEERTDRLQDDRIYTLFCTTSRGNGCHPPRADECAIAIDDQCEITAFHKQLEQRAEAAHAEQSRAKRARLLEHGEYAPVPRARVGDAMNELKASVQRYRMLNAGRSHMARFFELAAKCGDGRPTTLVRLRAALERLRQPPRQFEPAFVIDGDRVDYHLETPEYSRYSACHGVLGWRVLDSMITVAGGLDEDEFDRLYAMRFEQLVEAWRAKISVPPFSADLDRDHEGNFVVKNILQALEGHEEMGPPTHAEVRSGSFETGVDPKTREEVAKDLMRERFAVEHPKNDERRFDFVLECIEADAKEMAHTDAVASIEEARKLACQDFWTDCKELANPKSLNDDDADRVSSKMHTAFANLQLDMYFTLSPFMFGDESEVNPFEFLGNGKNFAEVCKLKEGAIRLARLRTLSLTQLRVDTQDNLERRRAHVESVHLESQLADRMHAFFEHFGLPEWNRGEPLACLAHGFKFDGARGVESAKRLHKYNSASKGDPECLEYDPTDADLKDADVKLRDQLRSLAFAVNSRSRKPGDLSITECIKNVLGAIGLTMKANDFNPTLPGGRRSKLAINDPTVNEQRMSTLDFSLADAVKIYTHGQFVSRAVQFQNAVATDEYERRGALSEDDEEDEAGEVPPIPDELDGHELSCAFNPDVPRREYFDAEAIDALLNDLASDTAARHNALAEVVRRLKENSTDSDLIRNKVALSASIDVERQLQELNRALGPADRFGRRALDVLYGEPTTFSRRCTPTVVNGGEMYPPIDSRTLCGDEDPLARVRLRPLCYAGLFPELRGALCGKTAGAGLPRLSALHIQWSSLVLDTAHQIGYTESLDQLRALNEQPDELLVDVMRHYETELHAQELLDGCVHGGLSHAQWLESHGLQKEKMPKIATLQAEVRGVRDALFRSRGYADEARRARDELPADYSRAEKNRTLWIRWLQSRECKVLRRVEVLLHAWRRGTEWVKLAILVEDCRCSGEMQDEFSQSQQAELLPSTQIFSDAGFELSAGTSVHPNTNVTIESRHSTRGDDSSGDEERYMTDYQFERDVIFNSTSLSEAARRLNHALAEMENGGWRALKLVAQPLESDMAIMRRARRVLESLPNPMADQFGDDGGNGDGNE